MPEVVEHLVPEPRVQQVQHGVFDATDVEVDASRMVRADIGSWAHPVRLDLTVDETQFVRGVEVTQLVPARPGPLRHHVGIAPIDLRASATRGVEIEFDLHPVAESVEWALRIGELVVRVERARARTTRSPAAAPGACRRGARGGSVGVVDDRERLAPVPLAAEQPVPQLVVDRGGPGAVRLQPGVRAGDAVGLVVDAVQVEFVVRRLHVRRIADIRNRPQRGVECRLDVVTGEPRGGRLLDGGDRQAERAGELEVALVTARHRHDRPGAVAHEHVVGDPHRDLVTVDRVGGVRAGEDTGLLAVLVLAFELRLVRRPACGRRRRRRPGRARSACRRAGARVPGP